MKLERRSGARVLILDDGRVRRTTEEEDFMFGEGIKAVTRWLENMDNVYHLDIEDIAGAVCWAHAVGKIVESQP